MTELPDATADTFPEESHYDDYESWQEEVRHWQVTHVHRTGMPDNAPIVVGAKFWDYDLKVVEVTEIAPRSWDSRPYPGGEIQTWHQTTNGRSDTMTGGLQGRLCSYTTDFYGGNRRDAKDYPVGTEYRDVK